MTLSARDVPAGKVPALVSSDNVAIKIGLFLATLVVYDASKLSISVALSGRSDWHCRIKFKVITFDKEVAALYSSRFVYFYLNGRQVKYYWVNLRAAKLET